MASRFQACQLTGSTYYPDAIAWSEENLIAVASGHLVTILNPASPSGPRGTIKISNSKSFAIGVIERKDLLSRGLLPTCLSRDKERPCVRSLSWSPVGLSSNAGCLLAVCTADGRVKLYRQPFFEFRAEWVEVMDISDLLNEYLIKASFREKPVESSSFSEGRTEHSCAEDLPVWKEPGRGLNTEASGVRNLLPLRHCTSRSSHTDHSFIAIIEVAVFPCSSLKKGSTVEVFKMKGSQSVWVPCILESLHAVKAHVLLQETDENGKQDEWIDINAKHVKVGENTDYENGFPKIRPSINVGCFPKELLSLKSSGVGEIIKVGQPVEAWTNDRWVKGMLMGFDKSSVLVKFPGDTGTVTLDACSVRLAPSWMNEQNSWQIAIVKIVMDNHDFPKINMCLGLQSYRCSLFPGRQCCASHFKMMLILCLQLEGSLGKFHFIEFVHPTNATLLNITEILQVRCLLDLFKHIMHGSLQLAGHCLQGMRDHILRFYWLPRALMGGELVGKSGCEMVRT